MSRVQVRQYSFVTQWSSCSRSSADVQDRLHSDAIQSERPCSCRSDQRPRFFPPLFEHQLRSRPWGLNSEGEARIIDSSFTEVRIQHNTAEENKIIKSGEGESLWLDQPAKKRQKDIDARWTKKGSKSFFGYKLHTKVCAQTKLIVQIHTTPAHVHDSQVVAPLLNAKDKEKQVYADAGYAGAAQEALVRGIGAIPVFCEKAYRNVPLTDEQKANNRVKSSVHSRIEHVFGFVENSLHGARSRYVGLARNHARHWMLVFCYNLNRLVQLKECVFRKTLGPPTAPV